MAWEVKRPTAAREAGQFPPRFAPDSRRARSSPSAARLKPPETEPHVGRPMEHNFAATERPGSAPEPKGQSPQGDPADRAGAMTSRHATRASPSKAPAGSSSG